jgi:hypothetical protein
MRSIFSAARISARMMPFLFLAACDGRETRTADGAEVESGRKSAGVASEVGIPASCSVVDDGRPLPEVARESSGLAQSRLDPSIFWTHNDAGNDPLLYAIGEDSGLAGTVRVTGATLTDWEDISAGQCGSSSCLYIGDIGDNDERRRSITIYEVREPPAAAKASAPAKALEARYPAGARDSEAMFLAAGNLYLVTKGRSGPIELYRYPLSARPSGTASLELVREIMPPPRSNNDRVTAAAASPDGRWVGVRTYRTLYLYDAAALLAPGGSAPRPQVMELDALGESNGEGLELANDGTVWLSSEGTKKKASRWAKLACTLTRQSS